MTNKAIVLEGKMGIASEFIEMVSGLRLCYNVQEPSSISLEGGVFQWAWELDGITYYIRVFYPNHAHHMLRFAYGRSNAARHAGTMRIYASDIETGRYYTSVERVCNFAKEAVAYIVGKLPAKPVPQDCPACGAEVTVGNDAKLFYVSCDNLACAMAGPSTDTEEEAVAIWNRIKLGD